MDFAIINVAVPSIGADLRFSREGLTWVLTGLLLPFGGFLLVAGRAADLFGRKRPLVAGWRCCARRCWPRASRSLQGCSSAPAPAKEWPQR